MLKSIEEFKEFVNIDINTSFKDVQMFQKTAERKFVSQLIGAAFYSYIKQMNDTPELQTPAQAHIIELLKDAIANKTYELAIPTLIVHTGSAGIQVAHTENRKSAFEWQVEKLAKAYRDNAASAMESLIEFLLLNRDKAELAIWTNSEYAAYSGELFLRTAADCKLYTAQDINPFLYIRLRPTLQRIQQTRIKAVLGDALYASMQRRWEQDTPSQKDKALLDDIKGAMINLALAEFIKLNKLPADEDFMPRRSRATAQSGDRSIATAEEANYQSAELVLLGERYLANLKSTLDNNFIDYPEYEALMPKPQACSGATKNKKVFYTY